jgi:hypothetical protein
MEINLRTTNPVTVFHCPNVIERGNPTGRGLTREGSVFAVPYTTAQQ